MVVIQIQIRTMIVIKIEHLKEGVVGISGKILKILFNSID